MVRQSIAQLGGSKGERVASAPHATHRERFHLAPIDRCYRMAAIVRQNWKGLSGGDEVWQALDAFFEELASESRPFREVRS